MVLGDIFLMFGELGLIKKFKESLIMGKKSNKCWGKFFEIIGWDVRD